MKQYIIIPLLFISVTAVAAPSVKKLGTPSVASSANVAVKPNVAAKVTPGRAASVSGNLSRVGSLRAKSAVPATSATTSDSSSASRFPVVLPAKMYNSAKIQKPSTSGTIINNTGVSDITNRVDKLEVQVNKNKTDITTNTGNIEELQEDPRFDSIRRSASKPSEFTDQKLNGLDRAWIWIEEPE